MESMTGEFGIWGLGSILYGIFWLVMLLDAIRREEWGWVVFLIIFGPITTMLYYFQIYRYGGGGLSQGFELPGAHDRRRIKELQAQIHHLDKAHHYSQLADIYFQQGKLDKAEANYKSALERDGTDPDTRAHYGQCLLRSKRPDEALPFLEAV
jgi:cytochrome c-type biogenesis protein CcmH/NrfG